MWYSFQCTPDYLAPEIILAQGHEKPVDWWTLGVLIYEMLAGFPPFEDEDPSATYQKILEGKIHFPKHFSKRTRFIYDLNLQCERSYKEALLSKKGIFGAHSHNMG
ncbi:hypothetical protein KP509_03G080100 [Ceratopteris richardii]|uniref:Protein kinase domain-containing protein n=1 Tax=Ceratopteris richardii TaxID=49495 RepID=A0A8T2V4Y7_CERRI|nr:hypothetical protein KP509_03G080100 [Ceratopteris richardii]